MSAKKGRPEAATSGATIRPTQTSPKRKRLAQHKRKSSDPLLVKRGVEPESRQDGASGSSANPRLRRPMSDSEPNTPIDWATFLSSSPPEPDWLVFPLVERGQQACLYSETKAGKSLLALDLLKRACMGVQLDDSKTAPIRVLYLDFENSQKMTFAYASIHSRLRQRILRLGLHPVPHPSAFRHLRKAGRRYLIWS